MATVKELKKWLDRFPDDAVILVGIQEPHSMYESYGAVNYITPELTEGDDEDYGKGWEFVDFRGNSYIKPDDPDYNTSFLQFGESN